MLNVGAQAGSRLVVRIEGEGVEVIGGIVFEVPMAEVSR